MAEILKTIRTKLPGHLKGIEESDFIDYFRWRHDRAELDNRVVKAFRPLLTAPESETVQVGSLEFLVNTTKTTKSPAYAKVSEEFGNFLDLMRSQYEQGRLRKDYRTFNNEPYLAADMLAAKLKKDLAEILTGREGIRQEVKLISHIEIPEQLDISLDKKYDSLTEANAITYARAHNMIEEGNRRVTGFSDLLFQESMRLIGELEWPTAVEYRFGGWAFRHHIEPRTRYKHSEVIKAFIREMPKKLTKRSRIGDLVLAQHAGGIPLDESFVSDYDPRHIDGRTYVRLQGTRDRLESYRERYSSPAIEQNLYALPT
jgi:hypothetical protein